MKHSLLAVVAFLSASFAVAQTSQATLSPGTTLPIQFERSIDSSHIQTGDAVVAKTTQQVQLANGQPIQADDAYIREAILNPNAKIVAGYHPDVMPSFQGQISEEQILQLVVYIKSLAITNAPGAPTAGLHQGDALHPAPSAQPALFTQPVKVAQRATRQDGGTQ